MPLKDTLVWRTDVWTYALRLYDEPGVKELCLQMQNDHGLNVTLLLWSAWLENENRLLSQDIFAGAMDESHVFHKTYLEPLRLIRADLSPITSKVLRDEFKHHLLQAELCVEKFALYTLQNFSADQVWPVSNDIEGQNIAICLRQYCNDPIVATSSAILLDVMKAL